MPKWIHDRAEHLLAKNPDMDKPKAFAIATQQAHAIGKSPKDYGTIAGRIGSIEKYDSPSDDKKKANPGNLNSPKLGEIEKQSSTEFGAYLSGFFDEISADAALEKQADVSQEEAERALGRYESLERNKPTKKQIGRYAALGATAAPLVTAAGNLIRGGKAKDVSTIGHLLGAKGPGAGKALRGLGASMTTGAISSGAIPMIRSQLDRQAEMSTLKGYLKSRCIDAEKVAEVAKEYRKEKQSGSTGITPAQYWGGDASVDFSKVGAGAETRGGFLMSSELAPFKQPNLQKVNQEGPDPIVTKFASIPTTPAGVLSSAKRVGKPRISAPPGPSIADTVPTHGSRMPGANKTTIGKRLMPSMSMMTD
jgi:hypothetical protein